MFLHDLFFGTVKIVYNKNSDFIPPSPKKKIYFFDIVSNPQTKIWLQLWQIVFLNFSQSSILALPCLRP